MAPPAVHPLTLRWYEGLPEAWRNLDAAQENPDYPLLRLMSLIGDQLGAVEELIDRINYFPPDEGGDPGDTSDLADPATADAAWLPWLARLVGVLLPPALSEAEARDAVAFASSGWRAGTKDGMADAARSALTGTRYVRIIDHYGGDEWRVEVMTRATETPSVPAVLAAIVAKDAKPAGVELVPVAYSATWTQVEAGLPTWADWGSHSWVELEEQGAP
jgi:hypothetical protein